MEKKKNDNQDIISLSEAYTPALDAIINIVDFTTAKRQQAFDNVIALCKERLAELNARGTQ